MYKLRGEKHLGSFNSENIKMNKKYIAYKQDPELLKRRFEEGFPLLYPMDTVKVSSRWGKGKNPLEGRLGYVHNISHGLQSRFNRDYLAVGLIGGEELGNGEGFGSWLYTLDLAEKDITTKISDSILKQFGCLLYVDDRVKVISHPHFEGKVGTITSLQGTGSQGGGLGLNISDEAIIKKIRQHYTELSKRVGQEFQIRNVPKEFNNFVLKIKNNNLTLYQLLKKEGIAREAYERMLREEIYKEFATNSEFQEELRKLQKRSEFFVSNRDVELIERFPPNDLFKTDY